MRGKFSSLLLAVVLLPSCIHAAIINVFLLGGQSNMDGRADVALLPANLADQSDVMFYSNNTGGKFTDLKAVTPGSSPNPTLMFGPEITFGRSMADYYAGTGQEVALIKYAAGGTNLYSQWAADGTAGSTNDGPNYKSFQNTINNGLNALKAAHPNDTIVIQGMIWMQGESDAIATATVNGVTISPSDLYQQNLTNFISDIRLTYGAGLPFVIGELSANQTGTGVAQYRNNVRAAQVAVAAADPRTGIVNTDSFSLRQTPDSNLHFDANGQMELGYAFGTEMQNLLAIPEPSTYAMFALGLAGLVGVFRLKKIKKNV